MALAWLLVSGNLLYFCTSRELEADDLNRYVQDPVHGLHLTQQSEGVRFELSYRPADLLVYESLRGRMAASAAVDSARQKFSGYYYFILSLSYDGKELLQPGVLGDRYSELLQTLSFRLGQYVHLTMPGDTLRMADYRLDATFGMDAATRIMFAFEKGKETGPWLQFSVDEFGLGAGQQQFKILTDDIERMPRLKTGTWQVLRQNDSRDHPRNDHGKMAKE